MTTRWDDDGTATVRVRLPTEDAARVVAAVEERVKKMDQPDRMQWPVRRAEAMIGLVAGRQARPA